MPTPIPGPEKTAALLLFDVFDSVESAKLATLMVNYEDLIDVVARNLDLFEYYNDFLDQFFACFTDADLMAVNIWNKKIGAIGPNPRLIINSAVTGGVTMSANSPALGILGDTTVDLITLSASVVLDNLWLGPGASVTTVNSTAAGSYIQKIYLRNERSNPSNLTKITFGSNVNQNGIMIEEGATFGGITSANAGASCATPVTGIAASDQTHNTIKIAFTPPATPFVSINTFYKEAEAQDWLIANANIGDFLPANTGFVFRKLEKETKYDFKVEVMCPNGGIAPVTISSATICC